MPSRIRIIRALFKVRKYLSGSSNIRTFAGILGIGRKEVPEEEQIIELRVYRSEDKSADDVLSASESPEVAATKQKFSDEDDEESPVAEKLRECCDGFGREKPEMLGQSAAFLLKLGKLYRTYATNGKGIQQKLNFIKSAALIIGAMVRYEQLKNEEGLETSKREISKLQDEIQIAAPLRKGFNVLEISQDLKGVLEECRVEVFEKFNDVFRTTEESEDKVSRERLEEAYEISTKHHLDIMRKTAEECQDIMGKPPCKFTIVGLGSLARKETTLYSDFQHAILLEDGITESQSFDEVMEYFRWYTTIFQIIIIGLGETSITSVNVKSLNDLYSENQSKKWFSDEHTPHGICFDSMMPNACKIPLGRQEPTKNRKHTIELIQPVSQMAKLQTGKEDIRNGYHLSEILSKTIFVFGNREVYNWYLEALHYMKSQQTEQIFLVQQLQRLVFPNITASHTWFLYDVQERLTSVLSCLANLFHVRSQSGFQIVHELKDNGAIDLYMYYELMDAVSVGLEIKMKIPKAGNFGHVQVSNLVEEERVVSFYETVIKYTILLQHQLLGLLREDGILKMQFFPDETYWEGNKIITCRLGMQVLWKEVEFGLGRTYEEIDKHEKHAEISSAEAKFVIRMAYVALTTVFEYTVYLQNSIIWIKNSDFSLSGKLESHCRLFLQFLKDDNQALIYFHSMLFLIHYEQKDFQQAYEDYEKWQELRHSQQNHHTYRSNHWMDFLQAEVLSQVKVTDDTLERIKQQIAAEADIPERWVLTVHYCTVLLKMDQEGKAKKRLQMMAKRKRTKQEFKEVLLEFLLLFLCAGIRVTSAKLFKMLQEANTSERNKFLSIYNISGMQQEILKQRSEHWKLASDIRLESTDIRTLQHNYTTSLFEALSLAVDWFFSKRTKSASLLWSILQSPIITKPMMLDSVLMLFRHCRHGLSLQAIDGRIIVASESKDVPISKEDGEIDVGGCAVTFHRGSFDDVSKVHAKSEIDSSKWPPKYSCITAIPRVHAERNLLKRALVAMKSWCMKNSTYSRKIDVHVLQLRNDSSTWEVVVRLPQNDQKVFHFDCADLSPDVLGIHEDDLSAENHVIEGHVYAGKGNNFSLAFFLQNDLNLKAVEDVMANKHLELHLNFTPISVAPNDIISANLNCTDANFRFPKDFKICFKIDGQFVRQTKKAFSHSNLIGMSSEAIDITFECEVRQNERLADGPHNFSYEWRPKIAPQRQQPRSMRVITEIEGAGSIGELHVLGTRNNHDHIRYTTTSAVGSYLVGDGATFNIGNVSVHAGDKGNITHEGPKTNISAMKMAYKGGILTINENDTRNIQAVQTPSGDTSTEGPGTTERDTDSAGQSQQAGPSS